MNYPYYNPYQQQAMPVYPQAQNVPQTPPQSVRTVYSEAEARNAQIPTDGNPVVFLDNSGEKVYIKRFSFQDGSFPFAIYSISPGEKPVRYATIDDLEELRNELKGMSDK